jgi:hypothetical protein
MTDMTYISLERMPFEDVTPASMWWRQLCPRYALDIDLALEMMIAV